MTPAEAGKFFTNKMFQATAPFAIDHLSRRSLWPRRVCLPPEAS